MTKIRYVIVEAQLIVVGRDGDVLEHELQSPKSHSLEGLMFFDGQLAAVWQSRQDYKIKFYWSDDPKNLLDGSHLYRRSTLKGAVVPLSEGGVFNGQTRILAGQSAQPSYGDAFFFDGEHYWTKVWEGDDYVLREIDPTTGKGGRKSMPSFFEDFLDEGDELRLPRRDSIARRLIEDWLAEG